MASSLKYVFSKLKFQSTDQKGTRTLESPVSSSKVKDREVGGTPRTSSSDEALPNEDDRLMSKNRQRKHAQKQNQKDRLEANATREAEIAERRRQRDAKAACEEPAEVYDRYGLLPAKQSNDRKHRKRANICDMSLKNLGQEIAMEARVYASRKMSAKLVFIVLRQQTNTIQGVLEEQTGSVTEHFVRWAEHLPIETIDLVTGIIQDPQQRVKGSSVHDVEISIQELHVVSCVTEQLAFNLHEATFSMQHPNDRNRHITQRTRLANRIIDLRTSHSLAIFRINSRICNLFRRYLDSQGFIEIHTPKLQAGATESGSSVFQVEYFGRPAFLA
ncbi:MAG: hypothetical protein Q9219_006654 [cf. Caloplaca sp. 3 TL-2023]